MPVQCPWLMRALAVPMTALLIGLALTDDAHAWWNDDWQYRKEIVVDLRSLESSAQAPAEGVSIPIGLHSGNFPYFLMMAPGGEDLRVIAEDDETPLPFHIESVDIVSGLARIWVKLPSVRAGETRQRFWIYYGNDTAVSAADAAQSWDQHMLAAYHFAEADGAPRDAAGYSRHAVSSTAAPLVPGVIGSGLGFEGGQRLVLPAGIVAADDTDGLSVSLWLRASASAGGTILTQEGTFTLRLDGLGLVLELADGRTLSPSRNLIDDQWQYVAVVSGAAGTGIFLNGAEVGTSPDIRLTVSQAPLVFGAGESKDDGFEGLIDELRIAATARSPAWITLAHELQSPGAELVEFGADESRANRGGSAVFAMLRPLMASIGPIGWAVIGVLGLLALLAFDAMISKQLLLTRAARCDQRFVELVERGADPIQPLDAAMGRTADHSALLRLASAARDELARLPEWEGTVPASFLDAVRSAMDAQLVEETNRLNDKMVWVTLAVSGGPFLGLLGTVIGVMLTFASIASSGDMNINTIAPGVAAALMTTIAGLLVAIPALFGYNYLTGKIARQIASLEVFADRLANSVAVMTGERQQALRESRHAA
jgi:biopolymer transport protein ExbB